MNGSTFKATKQVSFQLCFNIYKSWVLQAGTARTTISKVKIVEVRYYSTFQFGTGCNLSKISKVKIFQLKKKKGVEVELPIINHNNKKSKGRTLRSHLPPIFIISLDFQIFNKLQPHTLNFTRLKIMQQHMSTPNEFRSLKSLIIVNFYHQMLSGCIFNNKFEVLIPDWI